jgi:hypothetical protein
LGPLLFNIYFADVHDSISSGHLDTYADDGTLTIAGNNVEDLCVKSETVGEEIMKWVKENGLVCNTEKFQFMIMGSRQCIQSRVREPCRIRLGSHLINSTTKEKVLGVKIRQDLEWSDHVKDVVDSLARRTGMLQKASKFMNKRRLKTITSGLIYSKLEYCITLWSSPRYKGAGMHDQLLQGLQRAQNKVLRIGQNEPVWSRKHVKDLLFDDDMLSINQLSAWKNLIMRKKILVQRQPQYLYERVTAVSGNRETRSTSRCDAVLSWRREKSKNSFVQVSGNLWNGLPEYIRHESIAKFKTMTRGWIIQNVNVK